MKIRDKYKIAYHGLSEGTHNFTFLVNDVFFDKFEESSVKKADVTINIQLLKRKTGLKLNFHLKGKLNILCDRCVEYFNKEIEYKTHLFVEFAEDNSDLLEADDLIALSTREVEIGLDKHFYDYINLNVPSHKVHPLDEKGNSTCNQEMLSKIDEYSSYSGNEKSIDPRWEKLKSLRKIK